MADFRPIVIIQYSGQSVFVNGESVVTSLEDLLSHFRQLGRIIVHDDARKMYTIN